MFQQQYLGPGAQRLADRNHRELGARAGSVRRAGGLAALFAAVPASLRMVRRLARAARRVDVVVCFSLKAFVLAALAKPFARRPIVWFMNDILSTDHFSRANTTRRDRRRSRTRPRAS